MEPVPLAVGGTANVAGFDVGGAQSRARSSDALLIECFARKISKRADAVLD
jgi:hypothetical protein